MSDLPARGHFIGVVGLATRWVASGARAVTEVFSVVWGPEPAQDDEPIRAVVVEDTDTDPDAPATSWGVPVSLAGLEFIRVYDGEPMVGAQDERIPDDGPPS